MIKIDLKLLLFIPILVSSLLHSETMERADEAYSSGDIDLAIEIWKKYASSNNSKAQNNLGFIYFEGKGVKKDYETAYMWFHIAAQKGSDEGEVNKFDMEEVISSDDKTSALKKASLWLRKYESSSDEN